MSEDFLSRSSEFGKSSAEPRGQRTRISRHHASNGCLALRVDLQQRVRRAMRREEIERFDGLVRCTKNRRRRFSMNFVFPSTNWITTASPISGSAKSIASVCNGHRTKWNKCQKGNKSFSSKYSSSLLFSLLFTPCSLQEQLNLLRGWIEKTRTFELNFSTSSGRYILQMNCSMISKDLCEKLERIYSEFGKYIYRYASSNAQILIDKFQAALQVRSTAEIALQCCSFSRSSINIRRASRTSLNTPVTWPRTNANWPRIYNRSNISAIYSR